MRVILDGGQKVAYGTFDGVYFQDLREPIKVLALTAVAQVDVLDDWALNRVIRYGFVSLSLSIFHRRLTTTLIRGPGNHVPAGRPGSNGSASGAEARQAYHRTHVVLQVWDMRRADVCPRKEDEPALKHDQDLRAYRPEHPRTQQAYVPQTPARRQRHAADIRRLLHPRAVELDTLFVHQAMRRVCEWVRDY